MLSLVKEVPRGSASARRKAIDCSNQLKNLEGLLGATLFIRTTISSRMTAVCRALKRVAEPAFGQLGEGLQSARSSGNAARGALNLAIAAFAYFLLVRNKFLAFHQECPEIVIEHSITDALSDILEGRFNVGMRLGYLVDQDMAAKV